MHFELICLSFEIASVRFKREIPYRTGSDIRVTSSHLTNHRVQSSIFMNFKEVSWWRENGRLISILNDNFDCGRVFKGSPAAETWVNVDIGCLYLQRIGFFGLKVQRLLRNDKDKCFSLMTTAARTNEYNGDGWKLCAFKPICES